ncbi:MAG: SdiA-regulated domain-containing protein [Bacteroidales bacterium]|nr:SdiA-regulated domain-containing protein [Bacteroidales bacterium]
MKKNILFSFLSCASLFIMSCNNDSNVDFKCYNGEAFSIDTIENFKLNNIVNNNNYGDKITDNNIIIGFYDNSKFIDNIFNIQLKPMSEAEGKNFSGYAYFAKDSINNINSAFFIDRNSNDIYVWPDNLANKSSLKLDEKQASEFYELAKNLAIRSQGSSKYLKDSQKQNCPQLELLHANSIYMLAENDCPQSKKQFDISSFAMYEDRIIGVADKAWTTDVYYIDTVAGGKFYISVAAKGNFADPDNLDLEAVDVINNKILVSSEIPNIIYVQNTEGEFDTMDLDFTKIDSDLSTWGAANCGLEGMTVDNDNGIIYFAKERDPRRLFSYDVRKEEFSTSFDDVVSPTESGDISDLQYIDGYIYYLDRANCLVVRIDVDTHEKTSYSFVKYSNNGRIHIYSADYGMAEALLITDNAIFIGMDNNYDTVSPYGEELGLTHGSQAPSIFVFKRPDGF